MCVSHVLEKTLFIRMRCCKTTATASVWLPVRRLATKTVGYQQAKVSFQSKEVKYFARDHQ